MIKDQKDSGEVYVMGTLAFEEVKQIVKEEIKKQAPSAEPPTDLQSSAVSSSPISFGLGEAPQGRSDSNSEFAIRALICWYHWCKLNLRSSRHKSRSGQKPPQAKQSDTKHNFFQPGLVLCDSFIHLFIIVLN